MSRNNPINNKATYSSRGETGGGIFFIDKLKKQD